MSKGLWIVEELAPFKGSRWTQVALYTRKRNALAMCRAEHERNHPSCVYEYRAVHYSPTPRRRGKK